MRRATRRTRSTPCGGGFRSGCVFLYLEDPRGGILRARGLGMGFCAKDREIFGKCPVWGVLRREGRVLKNKSLVPMQSEKPPAEWLYRGPVDCAVKIVRAEGPSQGPGQRPTPGRPHVCAISSSSIQGGHCLLAWWLGRDRPLPPRRCSKGRGRTCCGWWAPRWCWCCTPRSRASRGARRDAGGAGRRSRSRCSLRCRPPHSCKCLLQFHWGSTGCTQKGKWSSGAGSEARSAWGATPAPWSSMAHTTSM